MKIAGVGSGIAEQIGNQDGRIAETLSRAATCSQKRDADLLTQINNWPRMIVVALPPTFTVSIASG